ncbi:MAG: hypothetical protein MI717_12680 [Spirochaetales bacterium]|nr:hypothetical protein [Spirochaetales bacterium]
MKKVFMATILLLCFSLPFAFADGHESGDSGEGRIKVGVLLGQAPLLTAGFPITKNIELNATFGTDWSFNSVRFGANALFGVLDTKISGETLPLSVGPQIDLHFIRGGIFLFDVLGVVRWEYTFDFPLNLFTEAGLGVAFFGFQGVTLVNFAWTAGIGVRYVL